MLDALAGIPVCRCPRCKGIVLNKYNIFTFPEKLMSVPFDSQGLFCVRPHHRESRYNFEQDKFLSLKLYESLSLHTFYSYGFSFNSFVQEQR